MEDASAAAAVGNGAVVAVARGRRLPAVAEGGGAAVRGMGVARVEPKQKLGCEAPHLPSHRRKRGRGRGMSPLRGCGGEMRQRASAQITDLALGEVATLAALCCNKLRKVAPAEYTMV